MHHRTCITHVPWCRPGSLTSGFLWSRCRGKRSRHSRCMRNPQFYVYGKRPMPWLLQSWHLVSSGHQQVWSSDQTTSKRKGSNRVVNLICQRTPVMVSIISILQYTWWRHQKEKFSVSLAREGNHGSPVVSTCRGQWREPLMFSLMCAWTNGWTNNRDPGDLGRLGAHRDVTVMFASHQYFERTKHATTDDYAPMITIGT